MSNELRRYRSKTTGDIVEYPEAAAAVFDDLVLVPSERNKDEEKADSKADKPKTNVKDGDSTDAK